MAQTVLTVLTQRVANNRTMRSRDAESTVVSPRWLATCCGRIARVARSAMAEASRIVLNGFELRTDSSFVKFPGRYSDPRV
jgi:hypothetical protein